MQDVQPYVSVKFKFVPSGGKVTARVLGANTIGGPGGSTGVGKGSGTHTISFAQFFFKKSDKFDYTRFIIVHEFGHVLGLYHEFARDQCKQAGITCTDEDPLSVMNYPIGTNRWDKGDFGPFFTKRHSMVEKSIRLIYLLNS